MSVAAPKRAKAEAKAAAGSVEVRVSLASGKTIAQLSVEDTHTGARLKSLLRGSVDEGMAIDQLCVGAQTLGDSQSLRDLGVSTASVVLSAVLVAAKPCLHLVKPCSAMELSTKYASWNCSFDDEDEWEGPDGKGNFCLPGVIHKGMDSASACAQEVAREMAPPLEKGPINLSIGGMEILTDEVCIISHPSDDLKDTILQALAVRREDLRLDSDGDLREEQGLGLAAPGSGFDIWEEAEVVEKDWSKDVIGLDFSRSELEEGDTGDEGQKMLRQAIAVTDVMAKRLTRHFQFSMPEQECMTSPVFWGGSASDGSIVGVLSGWYNG